jgi:hypothetical protein
MADVKDEFSEVFDDITSDKEVEKKEESQASKEEEETASEDKETETDESGKAGEKASEGEEEKPEEEAEDFKKLFHKNKTLEGMFRKAEEEKASLLAELEKLKSAAPVSGKTEKEAEPSEEITDDIKEFLEEYGYIAEPTKKLTDQMIKKAMKSIQEDVVNVLNNYKDEIEAQKHVFNIYRAHNDFEELRDSGDIAKWIDTKKGKEKNELIKTYSDGSTKEVIEMITQFKKEAGLLPSNGNKTKPKAAEAVTMKRGTIYPSGPAGQKDKNDFDSAFDEAVAKA